MWHFVEILRIRGLLVYEQGLEGFIYLGAVVILGGRVMWFLYVGINQVVLSQCSLESEFL